MAVRWLAPLLVNGGGGAIEAGVDADARWSFRVGGDPFPAEPDGSPLLPLLQPGYGGSWDEVRERVVARLSHAGLDSGLVRTFPFELPVLAADASGSPFWIDHADPWRPHVRERYAIAGLRAQFARLYAKKPGSLPLPPAPVEQRLVLEAVWRSLGVGGHAPAWSSGQLDAAVRWSLAEGPGGPRRLWLALFAVLRDVEPNVLHWNLFDSLWASAGKALFDELAARPPGELSGPLGVAQALLVLRFVALDGDLGDRVRRTLHGFVLAEEVDGRRYSTRFSPADLLS